MKTLHLYLTRQMLATLGMTVFVFTLLLMLGNVIKEVLQLVVNRQATLALALKAVALLVPYVLAFSLPIGMLTAALLVFGRFSAEQELTAARASGISLLSLVTPILLLSIAVSGFCAWLNFDIAPASRMAYKQLLYTAGITHPADLLQTMQSTQFGDHTIFVGKRHEDGTNFDNIIIEEYDKKGELVRIIQGVTGTIISDMEHSKIIINLHEQETMLHYNDGWKPLLEGQADGTYPIDIRTNAQQAVELPISDMTLRQLLDKRDELERAMTAPPAKSLTKKQLLDTEHRLKQVKNDQMTAVLVYLHRQVSFSFACLSFTLVGIPLGIRGHRRETSAGVAMALVLMLIYYSFVVLGQAWTDHPERFPYLIVWLPNFIFQAVGMVLLWRANRGI